jgi:hypothetical protein
LLRDLAKMRKNLNETSAMLAKAAKERDLLSAEVKRLKAQKRNKP